ncbi:MAG TPA: hypothetical protein VKN74_02745 [Candidatus Mcinerneyibacterium sp.]|nr:hypothetical protein [Candidatus Mcinerneyibacterium sp.]
MKLNRHKYQWTNQVFDIVSWRKKHIKDEFTNDFYHEIRQWNESLKNIPARYFPSMDEGLLWQFYDQAIEKIMYKTYSERL